MLLSFGAKNFFCFKEWVVISLALNSKVPVEVSKGLKAALTMCLKGGNASGKTNALKIVSFIRWFCNDSFNEKPETKILIETFFNNDKPSEFFVEFEIDEIQYLYECILTKKEVLSEKIYKKELRNTLVFHRRKNLIVRNSLLTKKPKSNLIVRSNASIISSSKQQEIKEFETFYNFFNNISANVNYWGLRPSNSDEYKKTSEFYKSHNDYLQFTLKYIKKFDCGISDIKIKTLEDENKKTQYFPVFAHAAEGDKNPLLLYHSQSSGTKALYNLLAFYHETLRDGGVLILDEFDINLHPDILPHLVELFENPDTNPKHAQLIFSTHSDIVDFMGKYKTYLFNKEDGECYCYRLDELKENLIRNDRPISPLYKSGKIGGVPKI